MSFNKLLNKTPNDVCNIINNYITEIDTSIKYSKVLNELTNNISYDISYYISYEISKIKYKDKEVTYQHPCFSHSWIASKSCLDIYIKQNKVILNTEIYDFCDKNGRFHYEYSTHI
jgi:hypothetical protein